MYSFVADSWLLLNIPNPWGADQRWLNLQAMKALIRNGFCHLPARKRLLPHNALISRHCPFPGDNSVYCPTSPRARKQPNWEREKTGSYDSLRICVCLPSLLFFSCNFSLRSYLVRANRAYSLRCTLPVKNPLVSMNSWFLKNAWWLSALRSSRTICVLQVDWAFPTNCATGWFPAQAVEAIPVTPVGLWGHAVVSQASGSISRRQLPAAVYRSRCPVTNSSWSIQPVTHIFQGSQAWQVVCDLVSINTRAANHTHHCQALGNGIWRGTGKQEMGMGRTQLTDTVNATPPWGNNKPEGKPLE